MKRENEKIFHGAAILGIGAFFAKLIGAAYRVPLTAIVGGEGIGLYQMVFPVYVVLLELSGAGVPNALAKIISSEKFGESCEAKARAYLKLSLKFFSVTGFIGTFLILVFSEKISLLQGNIKAAAAYRAIAPSVFLVCTLSCFRGYYQGKMQMAPTAISQIVEQSVKLICGLAFSYIFMPNIALAAAGAAGAVTVSETVALLILALSYKKNKRNYIEPLYKENFYPRVKTVLCYLLPITLIGIVLPVSQAVDSFIIINALSDKFNNATTLYGLLTGVALTVINLPVSVCYGIAVTAIPSASREGDFTSRRKTAYKCVFLTLAFSVPSAIFCYFFSSHVVGLLFKRLDFNEKYIAVNLIRILSVNVVFASLLQTVNAVLIGFDRPYKPLVGLFCGAATKFILNFLLVKNERINIYGGAIALNACYFVAVLINLISAFSKRKKRGECYADKVAKTKRYDD